MTISVLPSPAQRAPAAPRRRATTDAARASLTPETWTAAATDVLEHDGIDAVRVDALAKKLGVTRGSFYWHFKDREDLLRSVLQAWRVAATESLTRRLESASTDPREQLRDVLSLPFRGDSAARASRIELSIRAWARRDDMARQVVDQADASRIGYIAQIFSGLGYGLAEARDRALIAYSLNVACSLLTPAGGLVRHEEFLGYAARLMQVESVKP
jgi:AcrR family transcriptional regulator